MNWINVKDRLPSKEEAKKLILIWFKDVDDTESVNLVFFYHEDDEELFGYKNQFVFTYNGREFETDYTDIVTHWCIPTKPE